MTLRLFVFLLIYCVLAWSPCVEAQTQTSAITVSEYEDCLTNEPIAVDLSTDSAGIDSWWWDFGNGQTSQAAFPEAFYESPGSYDVTLTVDTHRHGPMTIVEENLIQINSLTFEDKFDNPEYSGENWHFFNESMIVDSALQLEVKVKQRSEDQQNGEIICLDGGGRLPVSSTRVFFDLQLIADDPRSVSYTPLRLYDNSSPAKVLAALRVQYSNKGGFEIGIEDIDAGSTTWHTLQKQNPVLTVQVDWYLEENGFGHLTLEIQEESYPAVFQELNLVQQQLLETVQLGIMNVDWPDDETSAGQLRIDNFRTCDYKYRPNL